MQIITSFERQETIVKTIKTSDHQKKKYNSRSRRSTSKDSDRYFQRSSEGRGLRHHRSSSIELQKSHNSHRSHRKYKRSRRSSTSSESLRVNYRSRSPSSDYFRQRRSHRSTRRYLSPRRSSSSFKRYKHISSSESSYGRLNRYNSRRSNSRSPSRGLRRNRFSSSPEIGKRRSRSPCVDLRKVLDFYKSRREKEKSTENKCSIFGKSVNITTFEKQRCSKFCFSPKCIEYSITER